MKVEIERFLAFADRGDILFVDNRRSLISKLIKWFTRSQWSHVALVVSKKTQWPKWIIEANPGGLEVRSLESRYLKVLRNSEGEILQAKKQSKYKLELVNPFLAQDQEKTVVERAFRFVFQGRKYDFLLLTLGFIFHLLSGRKWKPRLLENSNRFICSEFIAFCFKGIINFRRKELSYVSPEDIWQGLKEKLFTTNLRL
jgi:hypothetical protein